jgi:D-alanyl-lipoteichoic acid acyltransferase DltB (MBOAT superfamily)
VVAFGFVIYADFSAYTDIARGCARLFGFDLCRNFNHPYLAQSPGDFWRRWHMSLSTWFRDYVYIPLGGSQSGPRRTIINLLITFFLSGLWHGASWNFIIWGVYHGVLVAFWPMITARAAWLQTGGRWGGVILRVFVTYLLMHLGWFFFKEQNLSKIISGLTLNPFTATAQDWRMAIVIIGETFVYAIPLVIILPLVQKVPFFTQTENDRWPLVATQLLVLVTLLLGIIALNCPAGADFIYFTF